MGAELIDTIIIGWSFGLFEAGDVLEGTEFDLGHFEREVGALLNGVEFGFGHLNDDFLEDVLDASHFIPEKTSFLHLCTVLPYRFYDIQGLLLA